MGGAGKKINSSGSRNFLGTALNYSRVISAFLFHCKKRSIKCHSLENGNPVNIIMDYFVKQAMTK